MIESYGIAQTFVFGAVAFVLVIVIIALFAYLIVLAKRKEQKRREALVAFAALYGWNLSLEKCKGSPDFPSALFSQGHSRFSRFHMSKRIARAIRGAPDEGHVDAYAYEYHYAITTSTGKTTITVDYYFTCLQLCLPVDLGRVRVRDEKFADKLAQGLGFEDIDLEDPEFSARFVVKADERKDAYDLLGSSLMSYLLGWRGIGIQTEGTDALVVMTGKLDPHDVMRLERYARGFLGTLPRVLINNARVRAGMEPLTEAGDVNSEQRT